MMVNNEQRMMTIGVSALSYYSFLGHITLPRKEKVFLNSETRINKDEASNHRVGLITSREMHG